MRLALSKVKSEPFAGLLKQMKKLRDLLFLGLALALHSVPYAHGQAAHRVGLADNREGYESTQYKTQSEAVLEQSGQRLPLAEQASAAQLGLPRIPKALRSEEVDLGRQLFFDRRLSANANLSCAMCHVPEQGFTQNELATPVGDEGRGGRRNAPSLYNLAFQPSLFWDGREHSLEAQVWSPLLARNEMANPSKEAVLERLTSIPAYESAFAAHYDQGLTAQTVGLALAAYQRALISGNSPFDRWYFASAKNTGDFSSKAARGFDVFKTQGCQSCHTVGGKYALFTDGDFHNTGTGLLREERGIMPKQVQVAPGVFVTPRVDVETETFIDKGRQEVTGRSEDRWRYRTPSLRNVALTAPYMHDGSIRSLEAVVKFYVQGGGQDPDQDQRIRPLDITAEEQEALVEFLRTLTASNVNALVADARSIEIGDRDNADY
jgi:cytochrome c peroxidase